MFFYYTILEFYELKFGSGILLFYFTVLKFYELEYLLRTQILISVVANQIPRFKTLVFGVILCLFLNSLCKLKFFVSHFSFYCLCWRVTHEPCSQKLDLLYMMWFHWFVFSYNLFSNPSFHNRWLFFFLLIKQERESSLWILNNGYGSHKTS